MGNSTGMKQLSIAAILFSTASLALATAQTPVKPAAQQRAPEKVADASGASEKEIIRQQKPSYPLTECIVSHHELGKDGAPVEQVVNGRLVRLCCNDCVASVTKDPAG